MSAACSNIDPAVYVRHLRLCLLPPVCNYTPCRFCDAERRRRVNHLSEPRAHPPDEMPDPEDGLLPTWDAYGGVEQ